MTIDLEKRIDELEKRMIKLEKACLKMPDPKHTLIQSKDYHGLTGGINFIMDNGYFDTPKSAAEAYEELKKEGYYHSIQSVDSALRNGFVSRKKTLSRIKENGNWKYVLRK